MLDSWSVVVLPRESVFSQESKPVKEQAHVSKIDEELEESDEEEVKGDEEEFAGSELANQFAKRAQREQRVKAVGTCGYFSVLKKDRKSGDIKVPDEATNVSDAICLTNILDHKRPEQLGAGYRPAECQNKYFHNHLP